MKVLLSGNEAIARGAYEYGCVFASAYPGTPSTEILENVTHYKEIKCQWSPNEKVATEVAIGASFAGGRALCTMKHVGVNVAADPLMTLTYIGVKGGFILVSADDPGMHSSQNEQDNRNYAKFAKIPVLEPSDSQEAKDFVKYAFEISEKFDTPVILRMTTRTSHGKGLVEIGDRIESPVEKGFERDFSKYVALPMNARKRRVVVAEREKRLKEFVEETELNVIEEGKGNVGFITCGIAYEHLKEVLPDAPVLKLGIPYPLPMKKIKDFVSRFDKVFVVEELDPFIEEQIKAEGIEVYGKEYFPEIGEFSPEVVRNALCKAGVLKEENKVVAEDKAIPRPPVFCPGCPHLGIFYALKKAKAKIVTGDIGCYTLAAIKPFEMMDTCVCMGASIGTAIGMEKVLGSGKGIAAVIGDSTFIHSGITGLVEAVYNKSNITIVISDNSITAMTGGQPDARTGWNCQQEPTGKMDFEVVARAIGVEHVYVLDPTKMDETYKIVKRELEADHLSLIISQGPCVLYPQKVKREKFYTELENCTACAMCSKIGCQAIYRTTEKTEKGRFKWNIDTTLCTGCGLCIQMCKFDAIRPISRKGE